MKNDTVLTHTSRGTFILELFDHVIKSNEELKSTIAAEIFSMLESCLPGEGGPLTVNGVDKMWSMFHKLRLSEDTFKKWNVFIQRSSTTPSLQKYSRQSLQILLDRGFNHLIAERNSVKAASTSKATDESNIDIWISEREENVVWYMSGYVAVKLLKKYRKGNASSAVKNKWRYFVKILSEMKCEDQPLCNDTVEDYTKAWSEQIDRGGLYHVKPEVYKLLLMVEKITRQHLNVRNLSALQGEDINKILIDAIYLDDNVVKHWRELTAPIPGCQLDEHKTELLKEVCRTWITVRAHLFVEGCNFIFHKSFERGTRKTLKSIGTEKAT